MPGRRLSALTAEQPGALREVGMSALQVWQGRSEAQGRGRCERELAIVFTDLAGFSTWALDAGDTQAVAEAAGAGEVLVSEAVHERVEGGTVQLKRRWRFSAKGAPKGLKVYAAEPS